MSIIWRNETKRLVSDLAFSALASCNADKSNESRLRDEMYPVDSRMVKGAKHASNTL